MVLLGTSCIYLATLVIDRGHFRDVLCWLVLLHLYTLVVERWICILSSGGRRERYVHYGENDVYS